VQPGDLPRAVAERALLPRRAPHVLVSRLRDPARRSRHRLRGATLEPRADEVPAHAERGDPDRDDATGAALGLPGGDRPSRRCAVLRPLRQEGNRFHFLGRVVPDAARVPRRPPTAGPGGGVPADAAAATRARLDLLSAVRLADLPAAVLPHGEPALVLQEMRRDARPATGEI